MICPFEPAKVKDNLFGFNELADAALVPVIKITDQQQETSQDDKREETVKIAEFGGIEKEHLDNHDREQRDRQEAFVQSFFDDTRGHQPHSVNGPSRRQHDIFNIAKIKHRHRRREQYLLVAITDDLDTYHP